MKTECLLAIDAGTQSIRSVLVDLQGRILDIAKISIDPYFSTEPGWAEQDPEYYWKSLCESTGQLLERNRRSHSAIQGVVLTTQRGTVVNLDREGNPLRPAMVWLDNRRARSEGFPPFYLKPVFGLLGIGGVIESAILDCEANWIRQHQPELWDRTHKYVFLSGFFNHRLTGEYRDSTAGTVGYVPFDYKRQVWAGPRDLKWKMFPIEREKLVELVKPTEIIGNITRSAAEQTGIPEGLPLVAAAADKACEVLGSGCSSPEIACLSYGTTATIETTSDRYVEVVPFLPPFPSAIPNCYNTEVMIYRGYWLVSWFKKEFGHREISVARERKIEPEALFDEMIESIPPGSMGLTLQPYWSPGVKMPGPEAKGAIVGFGDVHTRAHVYRAILEGLAYALKEGAIRTVKRNKTPIERVRVSGGGSQSRCAMQLTADIFDMPAERPQTFETSALGAAIDGAVGLGLHGDFETAIDEMCHVKDVFEPIPAHRDIYQELFEKVYLRMYSRLKPLYDEIRHATGYPP